MPEAHAVGFLKAFGGSVLAYCEAVALMFIVGGLMSEMGWPTKLGHGSPGIGGIGDFVVMLAGPPLTFVLGLLVLAVYTALITRWTVNYYWLHCFLSAALAGTCFFIVAPLVTDHKAQVCIGVAIALSLLCAVASTWKPMLALSPAPALLLVLAVVSAARTLWGSETAGYYEQVIAAINAHDTPRLQQLLAVERQHSDGYIEYVVDHVLTQGYDKEAAILAMAAAVPSTPCLSQLRAVIAGKLADLEDSLLDETAYGCRGSLAGLATRLHRPEIVGRLVGGNSTRLVAPLERALEAGDWDSALLLLESGGYLDSSGKIDPKYFAGDFVSTLMDGIEKPTVGEQLQKRINLDELLVAAVRYRDRDAIEGLLRSGARANAKSRCGSTPLAAHITEGELNAQVMQLLVRSGAEVNSVARGACRDESGASASARGTALALYVWRVKKDPSMASGTAAPLEVLLSAGARLDAAVGAPQANSQERTTLAELATLSEEHAAVVARYSAELPRTARAR